MKTGIGTIAATIVGGVIVGMWSAHPAAQATGASSSRSPRVARGEYLVKAGACNDCHTPWRLGDNGPEPDIARLLSGHPATLGVPTEPPLAPPWFIAATATNTAWTSPLGLALAPNLTPHPTGVGSWTEREFMAAIRTGRHKGTGRAIRPPMPVQPLNRMTDEDLRSVFAYLQSIPAIDNAVPVPGSSPPASGAVTPIPPAGPPAPAATPVARGKYLVDVLGCEDCHTPFKTGDKGPAPDMSRRFSGYPSSETVPAGRHLEAPWASAMTLTQAKQGPWGTSFAANLTPDNETGVGTWTEQQFIDTLRSGRHQGRGRALLPPMPWPSLSHLTDADMKAVFAYLRTVPKVRNKAPEPLAPTK
jgi:hypothetical protein